MCVELFGYNWGNMRIMGMQNFKVEGSNGTQFKHFVVDIFVCENPGCVDENPCLRLKHNCWGVN